MPITFEFFVLHAALAAFIAMIILCRLGTFHSPLHDSGIMKEVTTRRFGVVLDAVDPHFSEEAARALLAQAGCSDIRPVYENDEEDDELL
jgi:hypothetical protein